MEKSKELEETIELLNPWWKDSKVSKSLAKPYKRKIFVKVKNLLDYKQIIILSGLRRVGKTTLIYQIIEKLLKQINSKKILYFNFDKTVDEITKILDIYNEIAEIEWKKEKVFVFLDEITKLKDWANKIKLIYDAFPNIKFIISSSSSINLEEDAIKNLGGRYFLINIKPLNFIEYLELKEKGEFLKNQRLYEKEIKKELKGYLLRSFPEVINWKDDLLVKDYLRTTIIDKVIKSDLPEKFKNINKDLLFNLLNMFYCEPGVYLDYDSISQKIKISKKTLIEHIFYLEFSYLLRKIKNFRVGIFTVSRKLQKVYPYWWSLAYCYNDNYDKIMENLVASVIDGRYYWRKNGKEIDFLIVENKKTRLIEVKNKTEITKNDLKNIKYFFKKFKTKQCLIIYNGKEDKIKINNQEIRLIPLWKWLLSQNF